MLYRENVILNLLAVTIAGHVLSHVARHNQMTFQQLFFLKSEQSTFSSNWIKQGWLTKVDFSKEYMEGSTIHQYGL